MPFSTTASIISTDLDNMLRGLFRDNADHSVTGTTNETNMSSFTITANTMAATGAILLRASGVISGGAGTKTIRVYLGGAVLATITRGAAFAQDWYAEILIANTATNAQRISTIITAADASTLSFSYGISSIDTAANQILKVTGQLGNGADIIIGKMFNVFIVQIN